METAFSKNIYVFDLADLGDGRSKIELPVPVDEMISIYSTALNAVAPPKPMSSASVSWKFSRSLSPSVKERMNCFRALERMTSMGVPLQGAILKTIEVTKNLPLQYALACTFADIQFNGRKLSEAMGRHPHIFNSTEVGQISAGEETGKLTSTFYSISQHLEMMEKVVAQIKLAMLYPIGLISVVYVIVCGLLYFLFPSLADSFKSMGVVLPLPTQILVEVSNTLRAFPFLILIGPAIVALMVWFRTSLTPFFIAVIRRVPLIRQYYFRSQMAQSISTLATLVKGGITLPNALRLVAGTTQDRMLAEAYVHAYEGMENGAPPAAAFSGLYRYFGDLSTDFRAAVEIGHASGDIPSALFAAAGGYQQDFIRMSEGVGKYIEPIMTLIIGLVVGGIVIAGYWPFTNVVNAIK